MDPAYEMAEGLKSEVVIGDRKRTEVFKKRDQFAPELIYFSNCVLTNREPEPSGEEGLADVRIISALLRSAESGRPVTIPKVRIDHRPESKQEISKKPVSKVPQLVRAMAPGAE